MLHATLEGFVGRTPAATIDAARRAFEARTGPFTSADACHEERIGFFFEWMLCEWAGDPEAGPLHQQLASGTANPAERAVARACATSLRGLWHVASTDERFCTLDERYGGARLRLSRGEDECAARLREGDFFDGRVFAMTPHLRLGPGIIFHPPATHEPMVAVLESSSHHPRADVLDGLLRMRMRLDRFTSIRPRHIYRANALLDPDILSAAWARSGEHSK